MFGRAVHNTSLAAQRGRSVVMSPGGRRRAQPTVNGDGLRSTGGAFKRPPLSADETGAEFKCRDKGLPRRVIGNGGGGRSHLAKSRSRTDRRRRRRPGKELSICARNGRPAQAPPPPAPPPRTRPPDGGRRLRRVCVSPVFVILCCCRKEDGFYYYFFFHSFFFSLDPLKFMRIM